MCIHTIAEGSKWIHTFPKGISTKVKHKQPYPGIELILLCPFPMTINIRPYTFINLHTEIDQSAASKKWLWKPWMNAKMTSLAILGMY